jgi:predicted acetyltransferase
MITRYKKFNENRNKDEIIRVVDEDRIKYIIKNNGVIMSELVTELLFDSYEYEFSDFMSEEKFDEYYPKEIVVKIDYIKTETDYLRNGAATKLMEYMLENMKENGYSQFFLNASPMGFDIDTDSLVNFYKKFGFEILLDQGHNVLMGKN